MQANLALQTTAASLQVTARSERMLRLFSGSAAVSELNRSAK